MGQYTDLVAIFLSGFALLFVWWIKDHIKAETANLKAEIHGEVDGFKMDSVKMQAEWAGRLESTKDAFDRKIVDAIEDKFVRKDVYRSDMDGLKEVMSVRFGTVEQKLDKIAQVLKVGV